MGVRQSSNHPFIQSSPFYCGPVRIAGKSHAKNVAAAWGVHITTLTRWQDEEGVTRVWKAGPKPKTTYDVNS